MSIRSARADVGGMYLAEVANPDTPCFMRMSIVLHVQMSVVCIWQRWKIRIRLAAYGAYTATPSEQELHAEMAHAECMLCLGCIQCRFRHCHW